MLLLSKQEMELDPVLQGAELDKIEEHTQETQKLIQKMLEELPHEKRILEGTELPPREEIIIPKPTKEEEEAFMKSLYKNGLSKEKEEKK
jgi:ABC-type nitrate/sulfonate/bicarbonate transport system substrate-binding protein